MASPEFSSCPIFFAQPLSLIHQTPKPIAPVTLDRAVGESPKCEV